MMKLPQQVICRIFAFPVEHTGKLWAFQVQQVANEATEAAQAVPLGALAKEMQQKEHFRERVQLLSTWGVAKAKARWRALEEAPPKTFKKHFADAGNYLLRRIHPAENFLTSIPPHLEKMHVVYPANLHPTLVRRRMCRVAKRGANIHRWWAYAAMSALPITFFLPSPVFFYNLFRAYANWQSWSGGLRLLAHLERSSADSQSPEASVSTSGSVYLQRREDVDSAGSTAVFAESKELPGVTPPGPQRNASLREKLQNVSFSDEQVATICRKHGLDVPAILKWKRFPPS